MEIECSTRDLGLEMGVERQIALFFFYLVFWRKMGWGCEKNGKNYVLSMDDIEVWKPD